MRLSSVFLCFVACGHASDLPEKQRTQEPRDADTQSKTSVPSPPERFFITHPLTGSPLEVVVEEHLHLRITSLPSPLRAALVMRIEYVNFGTISSGEMSIHERCTELSAQLESLDVALLPSFKTFVGGTAGVFSLDVEDWSDEIGALVLAEAWAQGFAEGSLRFDARVRIPPLQLGFNDASIARRLGLQSEDRLAILNERNVALANAEACDLVTGALTLAVTAESGSSVPLSLHLPWAD